MNIKTLADVDRLPAAEYIKDQIRAEFKKNESGDKASDSSPDVEQPTFRKPMATKAHPRFTDPVHIRIQSTRKRPTDNRALSEKAVVDALVKVGILKDDRPEYVKTLCVEEPRVSEEEETIITIETV